jgi:hypothetical protein
LPSRFAEGFVIDGGSKRKPTGGGNLLLSEALTSSGLHFDQLGIGWRDGPACAGVLDLCSGRRAQQTETKRGQDSRQTPEGVCEENLHLPG